MQLQLENQIGCSQSPCRICSPKRIKTRGLGRNMKIRGVFSKKGVSSGRTWGVASDIPLKLFNLCCNKSSTSGTCRFSLCWASYSSGNGFFLLFLFWGVAGPKPLSPPSPSPLLLLLLFLLNLFIPRNLSRRFCISNSLPGWLGRDLIKSLSVCFLLSLFLSVKSQQLHFLHQM